MKPASILFFGSTEDSVTVLNKLADLPFVTISAVVTQPPKPVGRKQILTPTPVEIWATSHTIAVLSFPANAEKPWLFADETTVADALAPIQADLVISASFGQKIPGRTLSEATFGGLNVHPSILPRWRGGDPVPWAIMTGDHQTGVTVVSLSETFDAGLIYAQEKKPITDHDTSTPLRSDLFSMGATLLADLLPRFLQGKAKGTPQKDDPDHRAKRLSRDMGFEPFTILMTATTNTDEADRIERKWRALHPWPGVWTKLPISASAKGAGDPQTEKRLKIIRLHLSNGALVLDEVQLEGKTPVSWNQFAGAYVIPIKET